MTLSEAKKIATENGNYIGRLTSDKDSQGEYTIYNDGAIIAQGYGANATEVKIDALTNLYPR
jgi:hypothetical protein|tara:strand:+ start:537 stop:722 length:186 start_codon:yes stop_codon:yes gene_type:complete